MPDTENYIGTECAAEFLSISVPTLRKWLSEKKDIPSHKIGRQWKFKKSELDTWVKSGKSADI